MEQRDDLSEILLLVNMQQAGAADALEAKGLECKSLERALAESAQEADEMRGGA